MGREQGAEGSFHCLRCGECCRHEGEVRLEDGESEAIAQVLGMGTEAFTARYTRLREDRRGLSLLDHPDGSCIFLEGTPPSCRIQEAKPRQCREFPHGWRYEDWEQVCAGSPRPRALPPSASTDARSVGGKRRNFELASVPSSPY